MTVSPHLRLWLLIAMSMIPVWVDFFKLSTDYSFRGLMIPVLSSIGAGVTVALARTKSPIDSTTDPADASLPTPPPTPQRTTSGLQTT